MKFILVFCLLAAVPSLGQFNFYGPKPFGEILKSPFMSSWTPVSVSTIDNKKYIVILDQATQSNMIKLSYGERSKLEFKSIDSINGPGATYGSMLNSVFQLVDRNTHLENDPGAGSGTYTPLANEYLLKPIMHSYYAMNVGNGDTAVVSDAGTFYIHEHTTTGGLILEFTGSPSNTTIRAIEQWTYDPGQDTLVQNMSWTTKYLKIDGDVVVWTANMVDASAFYLADANDFLNVEIANGSDFDPLSETYQPNATTALPVLDSMENSMLVVNVPNDIDVVYQPQLGNSALASSAASAMLDQIELDLIAQGSSLRYPKSFYLAVRDNMLSHVNSCTDVYNARYQYNNVEHVYFTNATDDLGVRHPFMVIACYAISTRPNMLLDVDRPPGGSGGPGYAESQVTRNGKIGEFLIKIPLKDYGLITNLLDNDLAPYNDLASDFDDKHGTTTAKDVYNYTSIVSIAVAVDGVSIYPAYNNNLRFAVEDAEVTSSGIHVGGGLELHYHADGHGFNGNKINLYNIDDYIGQDHPPVIGLSYDGIAIFGKYEAAYASMTGYSVPLDQYGGHDHGDGFGYHYHAHAQSVTSGTMPFPTFNEHFLMVGAWKGDINEIPGFLEVKTNQLMNAQYGRFAGATYTVGMEEKTLGSKVTIYPNPADELIMLNVTERTNIQVFDQNGRLVLTTVIEVNSNQIDISALSAGLYMLSGTSEKGKFNQRLVVLE